MDSTIDIFRTSVIAHPTVATVCLLRGVNTDVVSEIIANRDESPFYWGYRGRRKT
jgi:hypothetical protein